MDDLQICLFLYFAGLKIRKKYDIEGGVISVSVSQCYVQYYRTTVNVYVLKLFVCYSVIIESLSISGKCLEMSCQLLKKYYHCLLYSSFVHVGLEIKANYMVTLDSITSITTCNIKRTSLESSQFFICIYRGITQVS